MANSSGKLFGLLVGAFMLIIVLQIIVEVVANATNLTGTALLVARFLPSIVGVIGIALMLKDAGFF